MNFFSRNREKNIPTFINFTFPVYVGSCLNTVTVVFLCVCSQGSLHRNSSIIYPLLQGFARPQRKWGSGIPANTARIMSSRNIAGSRIARWKLCTAGDAQDFFAPPFVATELELAEHVPVSRSDGVLTDFFHFFVSKKSMAGSWWQTVKQCEQFCTHCLKTKCLPKKDVSTSPTETLWSNEFLPSQVCQAVSNYSMFVAELTVTPPNGMKSGRFQSVKTWRLRFHRSGHPSRESPLSKKLNVFFSTKSLQSPLEPPQKKNTPK